jgi:putative endonuclease
MKMNYTVYCLYSIKYDKIYVGYTSDLISRFHSHNSLATKGYTLRYRPWVVAYTEELESKSLAMKREKELKSSRGRAYLRDYIKNHYSW